MLDRRLRRNWAWVVVGVLVVVGLVGIASPNPSQAALYNLVLCAGNNGSNSFQTATNTIHSGNPGGIFRFENFCGPAPFPAGGAAFVRISENQSGGSAGETAYGSMSWTVSPWVSIRAAGGYTRQPNAFNDGWRSRFWGEDFGGGGHHILMQGSGVQNGSNGGIGWGTCSTFCSHLWPFPVYGRYRRFIFEMTCYRPAGCDRANYNATDANTFILTLDDESAPQVGWTGGHSFMQGAWTRGTQTATYAWSEAGSGIAFEQITIDGAPHFTIDHIAAGQCNRDARAGVGEYARNFQACPTASNIGRSYTLNTAALPDGAHNMAVCVQDYGLRQGVGGTGGHVCTARTVRTDNSAPQRPAALEVTSRNPNRYLARIGAKFSLPADQGSPITRVHHEVIDAQGKVVRQEASVSGANPTSLAEVKAPSTPGNYRLKVWLEDEVGHKGPAATAPIPRDTTPPAAPQDVAVTPPGQSRAADGFDVRWRNIDDSGSAIDAVHYEVREPGGALVIPERTVKRVDVTELGEIETPEKGGPYELRLWLSDEEGNTGAAAKVPLAYGCVRSKAAGGAALHTGLGPQAAASEVVHEGQGSTLHGALVTKDAKPVSRAAVCVFSRIVTEPSRAFLGYAITGPDGTFRYPVLPGASRQVSTLYRSGHREVGSRATIQTIVHPTFKAKRRVLRNKGFAHFYGQIPGPANDRVVIVLQARVGKGWTAFRRYRTRAGGRFLLRYRFRRTFRPTRYVMRAQVRQTVGYPYLQGNSRRLKLIVLPACSKKKAKRKAKRRSARQSATASAKAKRRAKPKAKRRCASRGRRGVGKRERRAEEGDGWKRRDGRFKEGVYAYGGR